MQPKLIAELICIVGACLTVVGVALVYLPAAFIAAGGGLLAAGLLVDFEPRKRGKR